MICSLPVVHDLEAYQYQQTQQTQQTPSQQSNNAHQLQSGLFVSREFVTGEQNIGLLPFNAHLPGA
jgi:hypothetical protein